MSDILEADKQQTNYWNPVKVSDVQYKYVFCNGFTPSVDSVVNE